MSGSFSYVIMIPMTVLIVGASNKVQRFSYMAFSLLQEHDHSIVLMHPKLTEIDGHPVIPSFSEITSPIDTVTLYVNPTASLAMMDDLIKLAPRRVIFNPGTESNTLMVALRLAGIECLEACTLILLNSGTF